LVKLSSVVSATSSQFMEPTLSSTIFGHLPGGEPIEAWTLRGAGGLIVEAITYGAVVTRLLVPAPGSSHIDVVLGFDNLATYLEDRNYFGAVVGRVAGRITGASFQLDGETYMLAANESPNHLHGGVMGFNNRVWKACPDSAPDGAPRLRFTYRSRDGEEGYPGELRTVVTYTVTEENVFLIETEAVADRPTPFNLTFHHYFNLAGEASGSIADHELEIRSDEFVLTDERMTLLGRLAPVDGRINDFRSSRRLGDAIPLLPGNHGDLYRVREVGGAGSHLAPSRVARLVHPRTKLAMDVLTTNTHLQLYTGAGLDGSVRGKSGVSYGRHAGVCLECEGYPDGPNSPEMGDIILRPPHVRREITGYAFSSLLT
jgi:aldose 1-epimerase